MKKLTSVLFLFVLVACSNSDDAEPVVVDDFIAEILSYKLGENKPNQRLVLHNDGEKYTSYDRYWNVAYDNSEELIYTNSIVFNYNVDGFVTRIEDFSADDLDRPISIYEYEWHSDHYNYKHLLYHQGDYSTQANYDIIYFKQPGTGFRFWNGLLYGFENGNLAGYGNEDEDRGNLEVLGKRWLYQRLMLFDDRPNIFAEQAIDFALGQRELLRSMNNNNYVGAMLPGGEVQQWEINTQDGKPTSIRYADGRVEFVY